MNKRFVVIIILILALVTLLVFFSIKRGFRSFDGKIENQLEMKISPTPTVVVKFTNYTNQKYGFSFSYPAFWDLPLEEKITPSQEHLYQITLNPTRVNYFIDLYSQPLTISTESFLRDYFKDFEGGVSWLDRESINNKQAVKFFITKAALEPTGKAGIAFRRGDLIFIMSTSFIRGEKGEVFSNEAFLNLVESFSWLNDAS